MSPTRWDSHDDDLYAELQKALRAPPAVPDSFVEAARSAYAWRTVDDELAVLALSYDSAAAQPSDRDRSAAVLVRGETDQSSQLLVFGNDAVTLHVEVTAELLAGQVLPPRVGRILLENARGGAEEAGVDDDGFFVMRRPGGPMRLRLGGTTELVTEWVLPV